MADNIFGIEESSKFARALAASEGVQVVQERGNVVPHSTTDGKIHIGVPSIYNHEQYMGSLHREISKQQKDMQFFHKLDVEKNPLQHMCKGILQAQRTEFHNHGVYQGRDRILSEEYQRTLQKGGGIKQIVEGLASQSQTAAAMMWIGNEMRNEWQGYQHCEMPPEIEAEVARLEPMLRDEWLSLETEEQLRDLLERIQYEEIPPSGGEGEGDGDSGEGDGQDDAEGGSGEGEGQEGEGDGTGSDSGEGAGDGPQEGEGEGSEGSSKGDGEGSEGSSKGDECDGAQTGNGNAGEEQGDGNDGADGRKDTRTGEHEQIKGSPDNGVGACDAYSSLKDIGFVKEPSKPHENPEKFEDAPYLCTPNDLSEVDVTNASMNTEWAQEIGSELGTFTLTKKVKKFLISQRQTGYEYGTKRGKVCAKNVYKLYGHTGSDPRIFKQKNATKVETDIAIFILGDCSGSMSGSRYTVSSCCQISMSEVLQTLRIQHMMMQFSTGRGGRRHHIMKKFSERSVSRDSLLKRYGSGKIHMGCNADGEAVTAAAQYLAKREESRKLLIVLSDGAPAYNDGGSRYLKDTVRSIEQSKTMDIVGVGIQSGSVQSYYTNSKVVNRLDELERVLLGLLRDNVLK